MSPSVTIAVCELCGIYWPCDDDNTVPICPEDRTENRDHPVTVYRRDS